MWLRNFLTFIVVVALVCGYVAYDAYSFLSRPGSPEAKEIVLSIAPGATFDRVAWDLKKAGVITDVFRFRLLGKFQNTLGSIRAGEYAVNTGWTPEQVMYQITKGQALLHKLSLREGLTWWEAGRTLEAQGFVRYEDFKALIHDQEFLRSHGIPFANAEGFLYPETYMLKKPKTLDAASAREVVSVIIRMFWKETEPVWVQLPVKAGGKTLTREIAVSVVSTPVAEPTVADVTSETLAPVITPAAPVASVSPAPAPVIPPAAPVASVSPAPARVIPPAAQTVNATASDARNSPATPAVTMRSVTGPATPEDIDPQALNRLVILASLVERETPLPQERPRVAGVYANRLRIGMLLQCDPTIIYGVGETFTGEIRRSQLQDASNPYNTYQHAGLPPGPICSASQESMAAAFTPEVHQYLYFVATGKGGHTFSKNLSDHNKAVEVYRRVIRSKP